MSREQRSDAVRERRADTSFAGSARTKTYHFDLTFLGTEALDAHYTLKAYGRASRLRRHTPETLRKTELDSAAKPPTHFGEAVPSSTDVVQLVRVYGPPNAQGFPTLAAIAIDASSAGASPSFDSGDVANALAFMHPSVTVLTPDAANTVLGHIGATETVQELQAELAHLGTKWNTTTPMVDANGNPVLDANGKPLYTFDLAAPILNLTSATCKDAKTAVYNDASLSNIRWNLADGVSYIDMSASSARPRRPRAAASGYSYEIQDTGPNYGVSCNIVGVNADGSIEVQITNSFLRHMSVFVGFMEGDGTTPLDIPDDRWDALIGAVNKVVYEAWQSNVDTSDTPILGVANGPIKFIGTVSAESTFLGVPVDSSSNNFTFSLPTADNVTVGKVRVLCGSLGVRSDGDCDPGAAWIGIAMTAFLDLLVPTFSLLDGVGEESSDLVNSIFGDIPFLAFVAGQVYVVGKDIVTASDTTGGDIESMLESLGDAITQKVITCAEVSAKLAAYFGAEEAEESVPIAGWAMKLIALEAAVEQLAQTIGEISAAPRVVEFDMTVTMNAVITLVPQSGDETVGEFAATATSYEITAKYSDGTSRKYSAPIADPKVDKLVADWDGIPIGGTVTFTVTLHSTEGWIVGKGQSATLANSLETGQSVFALTIGIYQCLYPLKDSTTYEHRYLLTCANDSYEWTQPDGPPTETAQNLGSGPGGAYLEGVMQITLNEDLGVLGYVWLATGLGVPPINTSDSGDVPLYAFKNISTDDDADSGVMNVPAGYDLSPQLVYLRDITQDGSTISQPVCLFVDPSGAEDTGFHLRQINAVTDPNVPLGASQRNFDLSTGTSWGRFHKLPTSVAIHANGVVVGVNPEYPKLQIVELPQNATTDDDAPWAHMRLGPGARAGLLDTPTLVTVRPDQTILVLEAGENQRIQGFSKGGHPVATFTDSPDPRWIPLVVHADPSDITYLAMATEVQGYVYVLSQLGLGYRATDYWLDVYTPTGGHLFAQNGLVAAALTVDLWRNLYTLNYQQITGADGRTEPSVSEWIPSTPNTVC